MEINLTEDQKEAVMHLLPQSRAIVWHKIGLGKTRVALAWMKAKQFHRPLIVCSPEAFRQWQDEIELVGMQETINPVFYSYGMLSSKRGFKKINRLLERSNGEGFDCLVLDELWLYKNIKSKRSAVAEKLSVHFPVIGLSGSMITNKNIEDLYGQARVVGLGQLVATSMTNFREQFCIEVENYAGFIDRLPKRHAVEVIQERLKKNIHICFPKETKEIREIPVRLDATNEQTALRQKLIKEYYVEIQTVDAAKRFELEIKSGATLLIKLQQISDGFLHDSKGNYVSVKSNKIPRLIQSVSELLDAGERVLVWFAFKRSITEALKVSKFQTVLLQSGQAFDSEKWRKRARVCYATVGSGISLNDFTNTRYAIIYSTNFSSRSFEQAKGRTNRQSSLHSICWYYYFQTLDFPDAHVYQMLRESQKMQTYVIETTRQIVKEWLQEKKFYQSI